METPPSLIAPVDRDGDGDTDSPPTSVSAKGRFPQPPPPSPYSPFPSNSSSGTSNLSPIDMASLHSLSPGSGMVPGPPPPSPLNFSPGSDSISNASPGGGRGGVGEAGVTAAVVVASSSGPSVRAGVGSCSASSAGNKILKIGDSSSFNDKSPIRRFFIPPTLEKKHSSGDLHSRLKTRKMLGVGETDNGDIHRSKISQVLGHNEHLYLKLPRGYWNWQIFLSAALGAQAALLILAPGYATSLSIVGIPPPTKQPSPSEGAEPAEPEAAAAATAPAGAAAQYYGAALLGYSFLLWKFLYVNDKMIIRATQFATLVHFSMLCAVDVLTALQQGFTSLFEKLILLMFGARLLVCVICYLYLRWLGLPAAGLRRSPSYKEAPPPPAAGSGVGAAAGAAGGGAGVVAMEAMPAAGGGYDKDK